MRSKEFKGQDEMRISAKNHCETRENGKIKQ